MTSGRLTSKQGEFNISARLARAVKDYLVCRTPYSKSLFDLLDRKIDFSFRMLKIFHHTNMQSYLIERGRLQTQPFLHRIVQNIRQRAALDSEAVRKLCRLVASRRESRLEGFHCRRKRIHVIQYTNFRQCRRSQIFIEY